MSETKLLRCPCCDSENIKEGSSVTTFGEDIYIKCLTCGLKMQLCSEYGWKELFKRWNTRIPMQNIVERLEETECKCHDDYIENLEKQNTVCTNVCFGKMVGVRNAIEIVKEEGGISG